MKQDRISLRHSFHQRSISSGQQTQKKNTTTTIRSCVQDRLRSIVASIIKNNTLQGKMGQEMDIKKMKGGLHSTRIAKTNVIHTVYIWVFVPFLTAAAGERGDSSIQCSRHIGNSCTFFLLLLLLLRCDKC